MKNLECLDRQDLAKGARNPATSWQREVSPHKKFYGGLPADPEIAAAKSRELENARIGKTVMQSFSTGERFRVENYGTEQEQRFDITPDFVKTMLAGQTEARPLELVA